MEQLSQIIKRIRALITGLRSGNPQLFNLIGAAVALAAVICAAVYALAPGAPIVIASNLAPADRTALALRLRRHKIDFTLGPDSIAVPAREAAAADHLLAASPGFAGGAEDFSLFDHPTMGQSDFDEQVNYQRSLQGELERTIMDIHGVDSARVMLAMGRPSPFALGPAEAERASVMLTTAPGTVIDAATARAIAHLVAGSVRGLNAESVVVTGNDGGILYPPQRDGEYGEANRLRNELEHRFQEKVSLLLNRIMGENRFAAEVSVAVDTSRVTSHDHLYGKSDQAVASEEHAVTSAGDQASGIPGLTSNLPSPAPAPSPQPSSGASPSNPAATATPREAIESAEHQRSDGGTSRKDIVNYKPSSREVATVTAPIRIGRITVAVVLDGTYDGGHFKPLPPDRLEAIKGLLAAAVGAETDRGDSVEVQSAPLSQPYVPPVPNPLTQIRELMSNPTHLYEAAGAALVILVLAGWFIKRAVTRLFGRKRAQPALEVATPQVAAIEQAALPAPGPDSGPEPAAAGDNGSSEYEAIRTKLNEEANRDPQAAAEILRKWLAATNGEDTGADGHMVH